MSLRVQYGVYCDRCRAPVLEQDFPNLSLGHAIPNPPIFLHQFGMDLCDSCSAPVRKALAEAMKLPQSHNK